MSGADTTILVGLLLRLLTNQFPAFRTHNLTYRFPTVQPVLNTSSALTRWVLLPTALVENESRPRMVEPDGPIGRIRPIVFGR